MEIEDGVVEVWEIALPSALPRDALTILSKDERSRHARLIPADKKLQFAASRYALRQILGSYLGIPPDSVTFETQSQGKPELSRALRERLPLHFNTSHTQDLALCACAKDMLVGIDVEYIDPVRPLLKLADRYFAPEEAAALRRLPSSLLPAAFYRCWTAKEAYVKALGKGLHLPLDSFCVETAPDKPLCVLRHAPGEETSWHIHALEKFPGYQGALVVQRPPRRVHLRTFTWEAN